MTEQNEVRDESDEDEGESHGSEELIGQDVDGESDGNEELREPE